MFTSFPSGLWSSANSSSLPLSHSAELPAAREEYLQHHPVRARPGREDICTMDVSSYRRQESLPGISRLAQLPTELILRVMLLALPDSADYYDHLRDIMLVSKHWYTICMTCPELWAYATSGNLKVLPTALRKSKDAPLTIRTTWCYIDDYNNFMSLVIPEMHRWSSVILHIPYGMTIYRFGENRSLARPAPKVEHFELNYPSDVSEHSNSNYLRRTNSVGVGTPTMRRLTLEGVAVPWASELLKGLMALRLNLLYEYGPTLSQLRSILANCPKLRVLHIARTEIANDVQSDDGTEILLPNLKEIHLEAVDPHSSRHLLQFIKAPSCTNFYVASGPSESWVSSNILDTYQPWITTVLRNVLPKAKSLAIEHNVASLQCSTADASRKEINVYCMPSDPSLALNWLSEVIVQEQILVPVESLTLQSRLVLHSSRFMAHFTHVRSLTLRGAMQVKDVLEDLSEPNLTEGASRWLLPELCSLDIQCDEPIGPALLKVLERRIGRADEVAGSRIPPAALKYLKVRTMDEKSYVILKVKDIVGDGRVDWS